MGKNRTKKENSDKVETVGLLGCGEIGSAVGIICKKAGYRVFIREIDFDECKGQRIDYLHVNIPEKNNRQFIKIVSDNIKELTPRLTIIHSSVTPGTTRKIHKRTNALIAHSPVIGIHKKNFVNTHGKVTSLGLEESIKDLFPKIIGAVDKKSLKEAKIHLRRLGLKIHLYDKAEDSETAKLLDLVYYAWNIIFCKWVNEVCNNFNLNFDNVYTEHNKIYNKGYKKVIPHVARPILKPILGPIGGHCTIPDTVIFDKFFSSRFTKFILKENNRYKKELFQKEEQMQEVVGKIFTTEAL